MAGSAESVHTLDEPAGQARVAALMRRLAPSRPRSLLLEGGRAGEREALALYWAATLNCKSEEPPCGVCPICGQIASRVFRDLVFLGGGGATIKIDDVRALRPLMGEPPRGDGVRVSILCEAQNLTPEAANSLLKSMEEPGPGNVFVLTTPQRERLLPTLVSRSWCLTLAWPDGQEPEAAGEPESPDAAEFCGALAGFWQSGRGWFPVSSANAKMDRDFAEQVLVRLERRAADAYADPQASPVPLRLGPESLRRFTLALAKAREALDYKVRPVLVLDWLAVTVRSL